MKKLLSALVIAILVGILSGCGGTWNGLTVNNGSFTITPDEFISAWNGAVEQYAKKNSEAESVILLPAFEKDGEKEELGKRLSVTYGTDESGNMNSFELRWYIYGASEEEILTCGFMIGAIPTFFNPESQISLTEEFPGIGEDVGTVMDSIVDGDLAYDFISIKGMNSIKVSPAK